MTAPTRIDALALADEVVGRLGDVSCVWLFGSVARGDASPCSDIDLLVVVDDLTTAYALDVPSPASVTPYTAAKLLRIPEVSPLFAHHLRVDGVVLRDDHGLAAEVLRATRPLTHAQTQHLLAAQAERLRFLGDPAPFNGDLRYALARLYAVAKTLAMLRSALDGTYLFDRDEAFAAFGEAHPDLETGLTLVMQLHYLWDAARAQRPLPLPDTPAVVHRRVSQVLNEMLEAVRGSVRAAAA